MNIFGNWIFSFFMATGSSFSAMEETFPLKEERVFDVKEKNYFTYVAGSTGVYPSPGFAIGRRTKSLGHARDFSIGASCVPLIHVVPDVVFQGYAHWGYYTDWGSEGAYRGPGIGVGSTLSLFMTAWAFTDSKSSVQATIPALLVMCMAIKPSYTIGKEYETYFHQLDLAASVYPFFIASGFPAIVPTITYEIGVKF